MGVSNIIADPVATFNSIIGGLIACQPRVTAQDTLGLGACVKGVLSYAVPCGDECPCQVVCSAQAFARGYALHCVRGIMPVFLLLAL